ncbi:hypothetical protein PLANPX_2946 [Lacipirellula parvula]|uniref:Uncharacterized protein n=1 Tax=Lacipirellula parvula TaxID=2650471 RepID=A0A5K7X989_9BACT|nr:hypothetical protein PLANPX_2946 [Lacipirellula parvula]
MNRLFSSPNRALAARSAYVAHNAWQQRNTGKSGTSLRNDKYAELS